jgi:hypothetical protein
MSFLKGKGFHAPRSHVLPGFPLDGHFRALRRSAHPAPAVCCLHFFSTLPAAIPAKEADMRYLIALWVAPLVVFWGWYFLSLNDINFGYVMLSRQLHDLVFQLYGEMLGIDPATIPGLLAKACVFDTFLVGCLIAFRRRKAIAAWLRVQREHYSGERAPRIT